MALQPPEHVFAKSNIRPTMPPSVPQQSQQLATTTVNEEHEPATSAAAYALQRGPPVETDEEAANRLQRTVLAPFFNRTIQDGEENPRLWRFNAELAGMDGRQRRQPAGLREEEREETNEQQSLLDAPEPYGTKRKASYASPTKIGMSESGGDEHTVEAHLLHLADRICKHLDETVSNENIHLCGLGPLRIMESRPDEVLDLAHQKLHTWPYRDVPMCWRRLYEDAALSKAASLIRTKAEQIGGVISPKRRRPNGELLTKSMYSS